MRLHGRSVRRWAGIGAAWLAVAAAPAARAEAPLQSVTLAWNAPASCPPGEDVMAEVAKLVPAPSMAHKDLSPVAAHVDVANLSDGRWKGVLNMETREVHSERTFEAASCAAIASAAALIIAVAIEQAAASPGPGAPVAARARPTAPPAPPPPATVSRKAAPPLLPPEDEEPSAYHSQLIVTVAGAADEGAMPAGPAAGAELGAGWGLGTASWRLRLAASAAYYPTHTVATPIQGQAAQFSLITTSLRACIGSLVRGGFEIGPCLGGEIDWMAATAPGSTPQLQAGGDTGAWGVVLGGVMASWAVSPLIAVVARAEAALTPVEVSFVLQPGPVVVHSPARAGARGAVGVELRFF